MKIDIKDIRPGAPCFVKFDCTEGDGIAEWLSDTPPLIGENDVEIDVESNLEWGKNCDIAKGPTSINSSPDATNLVLEVIRQDDDGVLLCRLGGHAILIELDRHLAVTPEYITCNNVEISVSPVSM